MKIFYTTILGLGISFGSHAQSLAPSIVSTAGDDFSDANAQISWTIGEPVIATMEDPGATLTQGFHQTELMIVGLDENTLDGLAIFPTPTTGLVNIQFTGEINGAIVARLFDVQGKLIEERELFGADQFNLTEHPTGVYLLKLENQEQNYTYQVIKSN